MSLAIRTVRRLDERSETKTVEGVEIESGVPIPKRLGDGRVTTILMALEVGESFVHTARLYSRRGFNGRKFTHRRISKNPQRYRIWRTK